MIYKFKSAATSDLIMLGPQGDALLRLLGREPSPKGIVEAADLPGAIATLRAAVARSEQPASDSGDEDDAGGGISLRRRLWPVIEMFERAAKAKEPVVWGV